MMYMYCMLYIKLDIYTYKIIYMCACVCVYRLEFADGSE